jgi:four helix bundle protein
MTDYFFDHDRLAVYRLSIEHVAKAFDTSRSLEGLHRHARDQWLRTAPSMPLNISEGNGKRSLKDRARFPDIARGSALVCAAIHDVQVVSRGLHRETDQELKSSLVRNVAILTRMTMDHLRCQSPSMVRKEIHCHLIGYNVIRAAMLASALRYRPCPTRLSFTGARQAIEEFASSLHLRTGWIERQWWNVLKTISELRVGNRPGRQEPRDLKRRPKRYKLLQTPRDPHRNRYATAA